MGIGGRWGGRGEGSLVVLLLAERARPDGARSTRALEDRPGCPPRGKRASLGRPSYLCNAWAGAFLARRTEEGMEPDDLPCSRNALLEGRLAHSL